jgi:hypothetical protein
MAVGEIPGLSDRQFPRYRVHYEEQGPAGLADRRLDDMAARREPVDKVARMLNEYRTYHGAATYEHVREPSGCRGIILDEERATGSKCLSQASAGGNCSWPQARCCQGGRRGNCGPCSGRVDVTDDGFRGRARAATAVGSVW